MSQQVSLLPALTLLSQVFFAYFFGFLGFLLALPLTVVAKVWINAVLIEDVLNQWNLQLPNGEEIGVSDVPTDVVSEVVETEVVILNEGNSGE
jgi:hypothetical protein